MFVFQAWLERNQEKFGSRQVVIQNIKDVQETTTFILRSSLGMWCSQKPRLRSVSSGKVVLWCAELLGSGFRFDSGEDGLILLPPHVKLLLQVRVKRMDGLPAQFYRS